LASLGAGSTKNLNLAIFDAFRNIPLTVDITEDHTSNAYASQLSRAELLVPKLSNLDVGVNIEINRYLKLEAMRNHLNGDGGEEQELREIVTATIPNDLRLKFDIGRSIDVTGKTAMVVSVSSNVDDEEEGDESGLVDSNDHLNALYDNLSASGMVLSDDNKTIWRTFRLVICKRLVLFVEGENNVVVASVALCDLEIGAEDEDDDGGSIEKKICLEDKGNGTRFGGGVFDKMGKVNVWFENAEDRDEARVVTGRLVLEAREEIGGNLVRFAGRF